MRMGAKCIMVTLGLRRTWLSAISRASSMEAAVAHPLTPVEWIGLLFATPVDQLTAARTAFERGSATTATQEAAGARTTRLNAEEVGRERVLIGGGGLLAADRLAMFFLAARRRRRGARLVAAAEARIAIPRGPTDPAA